jgi:hypothetical protein
VRGGGLLGLAGATVVRACLCDGCNASIQQGYRLVQAGTVVRAGTGLQHRTVVQHGSALQHHTARQHSTVMQAGTKLQHGATFQHGTAVQLGTAPQHCTALQHGTSTTAWYSNTAWYSTTAWCSSTARYTTTRWCRLVHLHHHPPPSPHLTALHTALLLCRCGRGPPLGPHLSQRGGGGGQVQHRHAGPYWVRQDAAGQDARTPGQRALCHGGRHHADPGGLRWR